MRIQIDISEQEAEILGSTLLRDIRSTRTALENGTEEMFPGEYPKRLKALRGIYAALAEAIFIEE